MSSDLHIDLSLSSQLYTPAPSQPALFLWEPLVTAPTILNLSSSPPSPSSASSSSSFFLPLLLFLFFR
jgi:hypothetical protein